MRIRHTCEEEACVVFLTLSYPCLLLEELHLD